MLRRVLSLVLLATIIMPVAMAAEENSPIIKLLTPDKPKETLPSIKPSKSGKKNAEQGKKDEKTPLPDKPDKEAKQGQTGAIINQDEDQLACKITPSVEPGYKNIKPIRKGNNLLRKAGSANRASGNYIQITGMVLDENCLPIQSAVVEIWQADKLGNHEWEYDTKSHFELPIPGKDNNFLFSGTAQTDNLGEYRLYTIFPGSKDGSAPYINITVKREGYEELHTRMYFSSHPRNIPDPVLSTLPEKWRDGLVAKGLSLDPSGKTEGRLYYFPITMSGINAYKRF